MLRDIRAFFDGLGFVEVETPVRIAAPAPEPHIDCPAAGASTGCGFLRASPELQMKRLLAAGMERIYQIGPCFREGERGRRHNPEFTMLEWYRANAGYRDVLEDAIALLGGALGLFGGRPEEITVREAYRKWAGWDPFRDWNSDRFDCDMALKIEPNLPQGAVVLKDYPPQAASLSRVADGVAERWELYFGGVELANAFGELTDPSEQRRRFAEAREERRRICEADYPIDEEFLAALDSMPPSGGVALGVDRLAMLLCGTDDIASVMAFA